MIHEHEPLDATLKRLADERALADRKYNDALTALDTALLHLTTIPAPPAAYDEQQLTPINQSFTTLVEPAIGGGLKGRLAAFVWRLVAPSLQKQVTFNAALVDHLNRNVAAHRDAQRVLTATLDVLRAQIADLTDFHSRLLVYLQQITGYVDTKDRETGGRALIVNAAVNALAEDLGKRWESMAVREQRFNARVDGLTEAHAELRTAIGIAQQAASAARREIERLASIPNAAIPNSQSTPNSQLPKPTENPTSNAQAPTSNAQAPTSAAFSGSLDSYKYVGFENLYRGSQDAIRERLESYLPYFDGASDVLDVGCGRGEFLDLLAARGITARGLDLNHEMVEVCRVRGLDVAESDVVSYLEGVPDASLGGLFAAQVVEHLQPGYLLRFLDLAFQKLRPGAPIVLETLNPACWTAFFDSFIRDITHVWPLHPDTLRYLVLASGFPAARIEYRSPVAPQDRLQAVPRLRGEATLAGHAPDEAGTDDLVETFNANVEKLNARMFTFLDYAIVGAR